MNPCDEAWLHTPPLSRGGATPTRTRDQYFGIEISAGAHFRLALNPLAEGINSELLRPMPGSRGWGVNLLIGLGTF